MRRGEPDHIVISLTDPALFECPFIMMTEVGNAYISPEEAVKLREYLQKGGFLWADDFWGSDAWENWEQRARQGAAVRTTTRSSNCRRTTRSSGSSFRSRRSSQIASINFWMGSGGETSEWGADSAVARAMGVADAQGRLMVLMTHNTDFGDSWEREADDPNYFYRFSVDGYAFGINSVLYALSH